ncbi:MAG: hypothetical protein R2694_07625 [Ilumatobacteraceae bacterium]
MTDCYLAIDVGGTKLGAAIVGVDGDVILRDRVATPPATCGRRWPGWCAACWLPRPADRSAVASGAAGR